MKIAIAEKNRLSITTQYTATIFGLSVAGILLLAFMLLYKQIQQNNQYIQKLGEVVVKQLAFSIDELVADNKKAQLHELIEEYARDFSIKGVAIFAKDGTIITKAGKLPKRNAIDLHEKYYTLPFSSDDSLFHWGSQFIIYNHGIYHDGQLIGYAVVVFSYQLMHEDFQNQVILMLSITFILILIVSLAAIQIGRYLATPIKDLLSATESIGEGKIDLIPERRNDEIGSLINAINAMSQGLIRKTELEGLLAKFISKDVVNKVLDQLDTVQMSGEHVEATVLFADIVGFTSISEHISPADIQELLNEYYHYFNTCARFYFGTVDKYIGDCVMVVFGALKPDPKHQYHAVACAILMQKLAEKLNQRRKKEGLFSIELRIGINSGKMLAGLIGSSERMEYTVVGDAVNLASRLCNEADGAQIIIEESLYHAINPYHKIEVEMFKSIRIRGKQELITIYSVKDIEQSYQVVMDDLIKDILSD